MGLLSLSMPIVAGAQGTSEESSVTRPVMEEVRIIGSLEEARQVAGSGAVVDSKQLRVQTSTDINQVLKTVPGAYILEEDGYGLRPNIGIRAASAERSSKVTLMEDGVMIAPAPYSNPAAYYFPSTWRMSSVEVLKGAPLLRHGPQTTGGVINLVSTPIPSENSGSVVAVMGEDNTRDLHGHYGGRSGNFGWLVETAQRDSDGFKDIDRSGTDAGYDIEDYVVKLGWEDEKQSLLVKLQYSEEVSNETYLGLTDADFDRDENRRYGLSSIDQMDNDHEGYSIAYRRDLSPIVSVTATGYYNEFFRDWFKLAGGGALVDLANNGDATARTVLDGTADISGLNYKHNSRGYKSYGVDVNVVVDLDAHELNFGVRSHRDEMDRFQPVEVYDQIDGELVFQNVIQPTGGDNRLEEADALSFWATDHWQVTQDLALNLLLRYEDVETSRDQFDDPLRSVVASRRSNDNDEWLPGISFTYDIDEDWQVLAGVHRGFSPLGGGAREFEDPETSINYEAGIRFHRGPIFAETIGFFSDFDNKTENCSVGNPCSNGATSGSFTTGEAEVSGIELQVGSSFAAGGFRVPVQFAYTYTEAEISKDNLTTGFQSGDILADIPEQSASLRVGLEHDSGWNSYAVAKYIDEMCMSVGCERSGDPFSSTESLFVLDLVSRYNLTSRAVVFVKVDNLLDEQSIISRKPDGARPNKPRTASLGFEYSF